MAQHLHVLHLRSPDEDTAEVLGRAEVLFAPLGYDFGPAKIDSCPRLKVIASNTTSAPHIDLDYARRKGIRVAYLGPETEFLATITPTAEHTWGLLLALIRQTPWAFEAVKRGEWNRFNWGAPSMLSRMTLGIIGLGRLGKIVARYGGAFGMKVYFFDPYVEDTPEGLADKVESLDKLVSLADVVCIHAHLTDETRNMVDEEVFRRFKRGAYLINSARGAIVDQMAMLTALDTGILAGAAVDVLEDQFEKNYATDVRDNPLVTYAREHENLLITPHIGGATFDAWHLTRRHTIGMVIDCYRQRGTDDK